MASGMLFYLAAFASFRAAPGARMDVKATQDAQGKLTSLNEVESAAVTRSQDFDNAVARKSFYQGKLGKSGGPAWNGRLVESGGRSLHLWRNFKSIICPFLSALVWEKALPVQKKYSKAQLLNISIAAGLPADLATSHVEGQFENTPSGYQDIFNLEGAENEHKSSTGINDCYTKFWDCKKGWRGFQKCQTLTPVRACGVPNAAKFEDFFKLADTNSDGFMDQAELQAATEGPSGYKGEAVDLNPIGSGTIRGAFGAILVVLGETPDRISLTALRRIIIRREFPAHYTKLPRFHPLPGRHGKGGRGWLGGLWKSDDEAETAEATDAES